ncbi:hypothetical protein BN1221_04775 [Brenneria goodwinii]|uniref:Uncharacterized protein n=1 Tax=Brenneria goodwinii TaxID=1109412 RepID=A0A0G4K2A7_9GAMM|nr:hypothetical protein BN1221_04775 [Brenneria goodwinii]
MESVPLKIMTRLECEQNHSKITFYIYFQLDKIIGSASFDGGQGGGRRNKMLLRQRKTPSGCDSL